MNWDIFKITMKLKIVTVLCLKDGMILSEGMNALKIDPSFLMCISKQQHVCFGQSSPIGLQK